MTDKHNELHEKAAMWLLGLAIALATVLLIALLNSCRAKTETLEMWRTDTVSVRDTAWMERVEWRERVVRDTLRIVERHDAVVRVVDYDTTGRMQRLTLVDYTGRRDTGRGVVEHRADSLAEREAAAHVGSRSSAAEVRTKTVVKERVPTWCKAVMWAFGGVLAVGAAVRLRKWYRRLVEEYM